MSQLKPNNVANELEQLIADNLVEYDSVHYNISSNGIVLVRQTTTKIIDACKSGKINMDTIRKHIGVLADLLDRSNNTLKTIIIDEAVENISSIIPLLKIAID